MTSFNPILTTNASGTFSTQSEGYVQGTALDDPAVRYALVQGIIAAAETFTFFGGVGISEYVPAGVTSGIPMSGQQEALGGAIWRATNVTANTAKTLTGFSVFNQALAGITTPQSPVPSYSPGMSLNYYRIGSGARIAVKVADSLVSLEGGIISPQVSWDFVAQELVPYVAAYPANVITNATWAADVVTFTTTTGHGVGVGNVFDITGFTPATYNGTYVAISGTTGSTLVAALVGDPGTDTVQGTLVAGGGALNVRVLDLALGNSMTVEVDPDTGFMTWNRSGSTANILI